MPADARRLTRSQTGLLVIDIQERLLPAIFEKETVLQNAVRLVKGMQALKVPTWVTEQYRKGLGPTVPELVDAIPGFTAREKMAFSVCGTPGLMESLRAEKVSNLILCGIEAHVCVCQSALDLLEAGFRPCVVADAVSSRTAANRQLGLERLRAAGAVVVSTEMVLFELLERAGTEEFKQILPLVK
jgi:nicotinamidase-related amidase